MLPNSPKRERKLQSFIYPQDIRHPALPLEPIRAVTAARLAAMAACLVVKLGHDHIARAGIDVGMLPAGDGNRMQLADVFLV